MSVTVTTPWTSGLMQSIAAAIRHHRMRQEITVQALADKCASFGLPISRTTLTKLEHGRREGISVPELLVIAAALEVAPLELVFPSSTQQLSEMLPGQIVLPEHAARWFAGAVSGPMLGQIQAQAERLLLLVDHSRVRPVFIQKEHGKYEMIPVDLGGE